MIAFLGVIQVSAQKKKELKANEVNSKIEWQYTYADGVEKKYKESEYIYDKNGHTLMEKVYDEQGNIIKHFEYEYDREGNTIAEITYNPKGKVVKREEFKYSRGLKVEKKVFGPDGKLQSRKVYEYKTFD